MTSKGVAPKGASHRCIAVVGAGPAGIMAALEAARHGAQVSLYDTNPMVGRKLLVTGAGRCNISNQNTRPEVYVCKDRAALGMALAQYGHQQTAERLYALGIPIYATADGWCYPLSDSAATVAHLLAAALDLAGVEVRLKTKISALRPKGREIVLEAGGPEHTYTVDRVVVATGGKAYPALGSKGEFFSELQRLGHTIEPIYPALTPLVTDMRALQKLQGVRMDAGLSLYAGDRLLGHDMGNLLFTQSGLSGPAAMNLSHLVSTRPHKALTAAIDLLALHGETLRRLLERQRRRAVPLRVLLGAALPPKVPPVILRLAGLAQDVPLSQVADEALARVLDLLGALTVTVKGTRGFAQAQISTGGVPLSEIEPETMASRIVPGLHLAGEVLDVIGPCGGFNLQFAWTSGALAGRAAAE
jgi:predicted Rossmann fold flavoprotein